MSMKRRIFSTVPSSSLKFGANNMTVYAIWRSRCWKCEKNIRVAVHYGRVNGIAFLWQESAPATTIARLGGLGVRMERRKVGQSGRTYVLNVCPHCNATQSDSPLEKEMGALMKTDGNTVKFIDLEADLVPPAPSPPPFGDRIDLKLVDGEILRLLESGIAVDVERSRAVDGMVDAVVLRTDRHSFDDLTALMMGMGYQYLNMSKMGYLFRRSLKGEREQIVLESIPDVPEHLAED